MRRGKVLILCLALLFLASAVNAIREAPKCEILEKPENLFVSCENGSMTIIDQENALGAIEGTEILETPFAAGSQELKDFENQINEGILNHTISLEKYGTYKIRINNEFNITVLYGGDYLLSENISYFLLISGIICIPLGALLFALDKKHRNIALLLILAGAAFMLMRLIQYFIS